MKIMKIMKELKLMIIFALAALLVIGSMFWVALTAQARPAGDDFRRIGHTNGERGDTQRPDWRVGSFSFTL